MDRVTVPRTVLGRSLMLDVVVAQTGSNGRTVAVDVEDDGRIISSEKAVLPRRLAGDGARAGGGSESGPRLFKFRVAPQGEVVSQNSAREPWSTCDARGRILCRGRPRFEMKFIRRAVADNNLLAVARQTADNKTCARQRPGRGGRQVSRRAMS